MTFHELGLSAPLLQAIEAMDFVTPTPVQAQAIPLMIAGDRDLVALARTGTGKTAAFGLPLLHLLDPSQNVTQALILAPTRELCLQITADMNRYAAHLPAIRITAVYGGAPISGQVRELGRGSHIVAATPGRAIDLLSRGALALDGIRFLVLDEADEMLTMGFKDELETILGQTPSERRTFLFSATMPGEIQRISGQYMRNPETLRTVSPEKEIALVTHQYTMVAPKDRYLAMRRFIDAHPEVYGIVFCRTRRETQEIADWLGRDGYPAEALHGDLSQIQRDAVMVRFRRRQVRLLIATDVAARGLDVRELTHVINYSLPDDTETYVHRSGRTGRAGKEGLSLCLVGRREQRWIRNLEQKTGIVFHQVRVPDGEEIRRAKLKDFLGKMTDDSIDFAGVQEFIPEILKALESLDKNEIISRLAALELGHLISTYGDTRDLNEPELSRGDWDPRGPRNRGSFPQGGRKPYYGNRSGGYSNGHSSERGGDRRNDRTDDRSGERHTGPKFPSSPGAHPVDRKRKPKPTGDQKKSAKTGAPRGPWKPKGEWGASGNR